MWIEVTLSDGKKLAVRQLGLFELDMIQANDPGPYLYTVHFLSGESHSFPVDLTEERPKPATPQDAAEEGTAEWYAWRSWSRQQAAKQREEDRAAVFADYRERVAQYILTNCLKKGQAERIQTRVDWLKVARAAMCPVVTLQDIEWAMTEVLQAKYGSQTLWEAYGDLSPGDFSYDALKGWEVELMTKLGETEEIYIQRAVKERAIMIASMKIPEFSQAIQAENWKPPEGGQSATE